MIQYKNSKNIFVSTMHGLKTDMHSFASLGIGKGDNASQLRKKALMRKLTAAIDEIDLDEHGIRVVLIKTMA